MGRSPCCSKVGLRRGPWSPKEDSLLTDYIQTHGEGQWRSLPKKAGLLRCGKSCRLRWMNYLRPGIKRGNITEDEEDLITRLHGLLGNRWSLIAGRLPGRTDNEIKNYWNTHLVKKLTAAGVIPVPRRDLPKPDRKKKTKQKKTSKLVNGGKLSAAEAAEKGDAGGEMCLTTKVYMPQALRLSSGFSRTNSFDSLASGTTVTATATASSDLAAAEWPPLFEMEDAAYYGMYISTGGEEDFLGDEYGLPALRRPDSISGDVEMLEKVYDEYLQLL